MKLTKKQKAWDKYKAAQRADRASSRATRIPAPGVLGVAGGRRHDECSHTPKHHKASGNCRKGCMCAYGARRAVAKARVS